MTSTDQPTPLAIAAAAGPRLLGDVGGTNARWAWQARAGAPIEHVRVYAADDFDTIEQCIRRYLADQALPAPRVACFGIATPITGDRVQMTNHPWAFSVAALRQALRLERCLVINDFVALAEALPALAPHELRAVGGGQPVAGAPLAVLGPGTGLGVAGLVPCAGGWMPLPGEGGHATLAAADEREARLLAVLRQRYGHVSAERALSGPGLVALYEAVCALDGVRPRALEPADVSREALAGSDAECAAALQAFAALLGSVAGNVALTLGALGGVFIGGGIVPALGEAFGRLPFRARFEDKGRFRGYLERVPTWVITAPLPALTGAARALDRPAP